MKKLLLSLLVCSVSGVFAQAIRITVPEGTDVEVVKEKATTNTKKEAATTKNQQSSTENKTQSKSPVRRAADDVVEGTEEVIEAPLNLIP